jgi:hypothetical protein
MILDAIAEEITRSGWETKRCVDMIPDLSASSGPKLPDYMMAVIEEYFSENQEADALTEEQVEVV